MTSSRFSSPASDRRPTVDRPWPFSKDGQRYAGQLLLLLGTAAIFIASAVSGTLPQPMFGDVAGGGAASAVGFAIGGAAFAAAWLRAAPAYLVWPIFMAWLAAAGMTAWSLIAKGPSIEYAVSIAEAVVLSAASLALLRDRIGEHVLLRALGIMLVMFGAIHLLMRPQIASLIPEFIPFAAIWPWITGAILIGSGLATLFRSIRGQALLVVAAMFLAWIPLVHAPRLIASLSAGEIAFAAMAIALSGSLIICRAVVGEHRPG